MNRLTTVLCSAAVGALMLGTGTAALAKEPKPLPPGLQKKAAHGQPLPPGWQAKLQKGAHLDDAVFDHGVVVAPEQDGIITIRIDDEVVRLIRATHEIVDILSH